MGRIYNRLNLWPNEQRDLERQQFNDLSPADQKVHDDIAEEINDSTDFELSLETVGESSLTLFDVSKLVFHDKKESVNDDLVENYLAGLCKYASEQRSGSFVGSQKDVTEDHSHDANGVKYGYKARGSKEPPSAPLYPSCRVMSNKQFNRCTGVQGATAVLEQMGCTGDAFTNLDYLMIPYHNRELGHFALLGIAPRQQFVFVVDSVDEMTVQEDDHVYKGLMAILFSQVEDKIQSESEEENEDDEDGDEWPLYTQWSQRPEVTEDGSPNAARQGDLYNCGIFTATNGLCLAYGYDLMCYRARDLDTLKRPKMLLELAGGFTGEYEYDILDFPSAGPLYASEATNPRFAAAVEEDSAHASDSDEFEAQPAVQISDDTAVDSDLESNLEEAHAMRKSGPEYLSSPINDNEGLGPLGNLIPSAKQTAWNDYIRRLPALRKAWKSGFEYEFQSKTERRLHPLQFNPKYFQKRGFLYSTKTKASTAAQLSQYPFTQRVGAYARFPVLGLREWQHERPEIIERFARNAMAAFMARYWDESAKPVEWLTQGFDQWKVAETWRERDE